ncbi:SPOR domain-containing protein [Pseudooceanicola aestuarii]|uniref:SPOR domain-containing protein n=1 Tax=Pseudooceanicola aestuarii TaxID=2697319 RepID=UPI0013D8127A|nr:SPOR domain-containing protein [Pseudooceanicola aestuarii]
MQDSGTGDARDLAGRGGDTGGAARARRNGLRAALLLSGALTLAGCTGDNQLPLFQKSETADGGEPQVGRATKLVERDIEAPEVFQVTEAGLWDGRPSLGGVWVAHPDVQDPERVLIRNTTNDKFVIGALFRRERDNPGPRLQVSSDAAAALGILAGAPTRLNVTALRRETVTPQADVETAPASTAPAALPAANTVQETRLDPAATARAIEAAPDTSAGERAAGQAAQPAARAGAAAPSTLAATGAASGTAVASAAQATPAEAPRKGGLFGWLRRKDSSETTSGPDTASASANDVQTTQQPAGTPARSPAAPTPARPASSLEKPFIQLGIFSVEQNARNTATAMRQRGIVPLVRKQSSRGKDFYRVIVGPASSTTERAVLLKTIKQAGFADAYAVTN